jgi:hypothetical protein
MSEELNTWAEWSKYVLKELERLNNNYEALDEKANHLENTLTSIQTLHADANTIRSLLDQSLAPIHAQIQHQSIINQRTDQVLFGVEKGNGLVGTTKTLDVRVSKLETFKVKVIAVVSVVQLVLVLFGESINAFFWGKK